MSTKWHYLLLGITVILCPVHEEPAERLLHSLHCSLQYFQDSKKAFMVLKGILSSSQEKNYLQMMLMFIMTPWFHWTFWKVWNPMAQAWVVRCHSQGWVQDVWKKEAEKKRKTFALHKGALFLHKGPVRAQKCLHTLSGSKSEGRVTLLMLWRGLIRAADPAQYPYTIHFAKNLHHPVHLVVNRPLEGKLNTETNRFSQLPVEIV